MYHVIWLTYISVCHSLTSKYQEDRSKNVFISISSKCSDNVTKIHRLCFKRCFPTNQTTTKKLEEFFIFINAKLKWISRSSHQRCSVRKGVLRNFAKFTGKYLCQNPFFNKVVCPRPATSFKKETLTQVFSCEFLRTPFSRKTSGGCF